VDRTPLDVEAVRCARAWRLCVWPFLALQNKHKHSKQAQTQKNNQNLKTNTHAAHRVDAAQAERRFVRGPAAAHPRPRRVIYISLYCLY
jgi:hypothetical protein